MIQQKSKFLPVVTSLALLAGSTQAATINLFSDTFSDSGDMNTTPNNSVSGTFAQTNAANYGSSASGNNSFVATESGGVLTLDPSGTASNTVYTLADFATDTNVQNSGELTIQLTDIAPSASGDWLALNVMFAPSIDVSSGSQPTISNSSWTAMGALFINGGGYGVREYGIDQTVSGSWSDNDITFELTNITGLGTGSGSFNYNILSGAVSLHSGTVTGDLSQLRVGIESREYAHSVGGLSVTTAAVPEPSTTALLGLGGLTLILRPSK